MVAGEAGGAGGATPGDPGPKSDLNAILPGNLSGQPCLKVTARNQRCVDFNGTLPSMGYVSNNGIVVNMAAGNTS